MNDTKSQSQLPIIGRVERVLFSILKSERVPAKIDTGADLSSIWASSVTKKAKKLSFELFAPGSKYYTGEVITLEKPNYRRALIANSFGTKESRYVVKLKVEINGTVTTAEFSLADRSKKIYPVLLGRKLLDGVFLVDVSKGQPLLEEEQAEHQKLLLELESYQD